MNNTLKYIIVFLSNINYILMLTLSNNSELSIYSRNFFMLFSIFVLLYLASIKFKISKEIRLFYPFIILTILSNLWSVSFDLSLHRSIGILYYLIQGIILFELLMKKILNVYDIKRIISTSLLIITFSALYEYYIIGVKRAAGFLQNSNEYALTILFLSIILFMVKNILNEKGYHIIIPVIIALLISGSRKIALSILLIGLYYMFYFIVIKIRNNRFTNKGILSIIIILTILPFIWILVKPYINNETFYVFVRLTTELKDNSYHVRTTMRQDGFNLIKNNFLFGYGLEGFSYFSQYNTYSHNNYIELMVSYGILGLIFYYQIYIQILIKNIKCHNKNNITKNIINVVLLIFIVLEPAFVSFHTTNIWFILAILLYMSDNKNYEVYEE